MKSNAPDRHGQNWNNFGTEEICPDFAGCFLHLWEGAGDYTIGLRYSEYCEWIKQPPSVSELRLQGQLKPNHCMSWGEEVKSAEQS